MPENIRAVVALLALAVPTLLWLRPRLTWGAIALADFNVRAGLWVALTLVLFLSYNFWLFVLVTTIALLTLGRKDSNPLGLYFFLLFLAPPFQSLIPGFGGINYFIGFDYLRLLSVIVLLPFVYRLASDPASVGLFKMPADKYLAGYLLLQLAIAVPIAGGTATMRGVISQVIDIVLPYYAFSRGLRDRERFHDTLASFTTAGAVLAVVALFETVKGWLLYASLPTFLDVKWAMGGYMMRSGSLRATGSTGHSIVLGYVITVAFGLHLALRSQYSSRRAWALVLALLGGGIVASFARGPWVGATALVVTAIALSPRAMTKIGKFGLAAIFLAAVLPLTPFGARIVAVLPFVGEVDEGSVDYRQQLFRISWDVLMMNPLLGSPQYMANAAMEQLRQGEGIIDMVNSYLGVAMYSGLVGLALFAAVFVSCGARLLLHLRRPAEGDAEGRALGLALFATLVGVLVTIGTTSSINAVPVVYWCLAGMCAAYLHLAGMEPMFSTEEGMPRHSSLFASRR